MGGEGGLSPSLGLGASTHFPVWLPPSEGKGAFHENDLFVGCNLFFRSKFSFVESQRENMYSYNCLLYGVDSSH